MTPLQQAAKKLLEIFYMTGKPIDAYVYDLREALADEQAQAVEQAPVAWTLTETLDKRVTTTSGHLWFSDPVNCCWTPLYTHPAPPPAPPATGERAELIRELRSRIVGDPFPLMHRAANMLGTDTEAQQVAVPVPMTDEQAQACIKCGAPLGTLHNPAGNLKCGGWPGRVTAADCTKQAQAVEPVCRNCLGYGWEPHMYRGRIPCSHCHPPPPATGERAALIAELRDVHARRWALGMPVFSKAADMLEADERELELLGSACDKIRISTRNEIQLYLSRIIELTEAQQVAVSVGYALVPIEPTLEMIAAARDLVVHDTAYEGYRSVYKAMLAAAQGAKP